MTQTLEYIRVDSLKNGDMFGLIIQCTLQGEAVNFARGESVGTTIQRLRDLADRLERHTQETPADDGPDPERACSGYEAPAEACMAKVRQHFDERRRKSRCPHGVSELNHCNTCD